MANHRAVILIGEDQQMRRIIEQMQRALGFELISVSDCCSAVSVLKSLQQPTPICLIAMTCSHLSKRNTKSLGLIRKYCPYSICVAFAEKDHAEDMFDIAKGEDGFRFISEPWYEEKVFSVLEKAFAEYEMWDENNRLVSALSKAQQELKDLGVELEVKVKDKVEQLAKAINYDSLTGLPSKNLIHDQLEHVVQYAKRAGQVIVVLYLGLDNFKLINESMGYKAGDELLKLVTERLSISLSSSDALARMGGDEFCLIINNTQVSEKLDQIAKRFLELIMVPFELNRREIFLTASIGVSVFPDDTRSASILFSNAEAAMRQVKVNSKNDFQHYSGKLNQFARKRLSLESQLRKALDRNEFELYYQPRVNIESGLIVAVEALLRWHHPKKGLLFPGDFLPVLEETGLIEPVGEWVIEESCRTLVRWRDIDLKDVNIGVNLSAKQFRNVNLIKLVENIISKTNMPALGNGLEFEITESLLMENVANAKQVLGGFNEMGIKLAIDDFGTGYSSLSYLIQFPLDYLKVDKSFVTDIADSDDAKAIVEAIISLAYSLKLSVIAEGVESIEQLNTLQALACKEFQGFLFSEPLVEEEVVRLLKADKRLSLNTLTSSGYKEAMQRTDIKH